MRTQQVLWGCEQIPTLKHRLCLDPGLWLKPLLQIHVGILTYRVMLCFNQIKETMQVQIPASSLGPRLMNTELFPRLLP